MSEETFVRELGRRAEEVAGAPLDFEAVRGRAVRIRRRRRLGAAVAVVAVVAAVVAPFALAGGPDDSAPDPAPAPRPAPGSSVLHDRVLTRPDGTTVRLDVDNADVLELGVLTDGRVVAALQEPYAIRVYSPDGAVQATYPPAYNTITMSASDNAAAWVGEDLRVRVLTSGTAEPAVLGAIPMPGDDAGSIDAVVDPSHLLVGDHTTTTGVLTPDGITDLAAPEPFRVEDVSPDGGLWAVTFVPTADHEQYGCFGLYDPEAGTITQRACDAAPLGFAPDGKHVLTGYPENNMVGSAQVLDLDLRTVATVTPPDGSAVSRIDWADATHLLAAVADLATNDWTLDRVDAETGEQEAVAGRTGGVNPEMGAEYVFSE